uniref:Retrotransposon gag protein n=1 Tax=Solanum tuberosum TaxID=4113 RepID=M1DVK1_SOLTU
MASSIRELIDILPLEVMIFRERILTFKQMEGERIPKSWARFNELINQSPNHDIPDIDLLDYFYRSLGPGNNRLVDQLILGGIAKQPFVIEAQLLNQMAETNQEVGNDFMLAALMTQMDKLGKNMVKIEIQCKRKDKYIPSHERRSLKDNEVKFLEVKMRKVSKSAGWQVEDPVGELQK